MRLRHPSIPSVLPAIAALALALSACEAPEGPTATAPGAPAPTAPTTAPAEVWPKPMLPVHPLPGELSTGKEDAYDDYRLANPAVYNITAGPGTPVIPSPEFGPQKGLMISYTGSFPDVVAKIVQAANPVTTLYVVHDGNSAKTDFQSKMSQYGVSTAGVQYLNFKNDSIWIRDFGPISVYDADTGKVGLVDPRYYHQRIYDDAIPHKAGQAWGLNTFKMPVAFEGGTFMTDGNGTCFVTQGVLWYNGTSEANIRKYFREYVGCYQLVILNPLDGEGTTHTDMFAKMVDEDTVILGEYTSAQDAGNKALMDQNAAILGGVVLAGGKSVEVVRMPMPSNSNRTVWRTYVNSQLVNGVNMWPVYSDSTTYQAQAAAIWQQVLPDYAHVPIDTKGLIQWSGAIHCILMEVRDGGWSAFQTAPAQICSSSKCYPTSTGGNSGCGSVTVPGACASGQASWCDFGQVQTATCGAGQACGWDPDGGHYGCVDGSACVPSCGGKACGSDGCGGVCGTCAAGQVCSAGQCVSDGSCGDIGSVGCCEGSTLKYCNSQNSLSTQQCQSCGWDSNDGWYDCGYSGSDPTGQNPKACPGACTPQCGGKECGGDGCGGSCGSCGAGETCSSGQCVSTCTPSCAGKQCGDDGCGGSCGSCGSGAVCEAGQCVSNCTPSCAGKECGDNGCGGSCGSCGSGEICDAGQCSTLSSNGCGTVSWEGNCTDGKVTYCDNGQLVSQTCQSGCCGWYPQDQYYWCYSAQYCGYCYNECQAGSKGCSAQGTHAWTCQSPSGDGGCTKRAWTFCAEGCDAATGSCKAPTCTPSCGGKTCGDDGCGGSCGTCAAGQACEAGQCVAECVPACDGKACGSDGCGGSCGACGAGQTCTDAGQCVDTCVPACDGKQCGGDGCGGSCGACGAGQLCSGGQCVSSCQPDCQGKACGADGCGGTCGACPSGLICTDDGACVETCTASCAGKVCGGNGCGGSCGTCGEGEACEGGQCVAACVPACDGKSCGPDGCGGSCGSCPAGESCNDGVCEAGSACGDVTYEGKCEGDTVVWCEGGALQSFDCGAAGDGKVCGFKAGTGYTCVPAASCTPSCAGKACGDDGCGGSCGGCAGGTTCQAGQCVADPVGPDATTGDEDAEVGDDVGPGEGEVKGGGQDDVGPGTPDVTAAAGGGSRPSGCAGGGAGAGGGLLLAAGLALMALARRRRQV